MTKHTNTSNGAELSAAEVSSIEESLMDLEIEELVEGDTAVEEIGLSAMGELDETDEAALEMVIAKDEVYAEQESSEVLDEPVAVIKEKKAKAAKAPKAPRAAAAPKAPAPTRDPAMLPESAFILTPAHSAIDPEVNKADVLASRPLQKKIAEKFDNLLVSLAAGRAPSVYTMDCFRVLDLKKSCTSGDLVAALCATTKRGGSDTYSIGTARSQVGQCMELFKVLGIADRAKSALTLNEDSLLAVQLRAFA